MVFLIISGIPNCVQQSELEDVARGIFQELDINVSTEDISAIHRIGKPNRRYPTRVIVRFVNRKFVDLCFQRQGRLSNLKTVLHMDISFSASLASLNQEAVRICDYLVEDGQIKKYFLRNGFVKIIGNNIHDRPVRINHPNLLREKFNVPISIT